MKKYLFLLLVVTASFCGTAQAVMPLVFPKKVSAAFSPTDIPGLQMWLVADSIGLTDGAAVSTWTDSSGKGSRDATQSGSPRPIYKTGILNGHAAVRFNGTDQFMVTATANYAAQTHFIVYMKKSGAVNSYQGIFTCRTTPNANRSGASDATYGIGTTVVGLNLIDLNSVSGLGGTYTSYVAVDGVSQSTAEFNDYDGGHGAPASLDVYHYVSVVETAATTSGAKIFTIGTDTYSGNAFLTGDILTILIYDTALSSGNRTLVENYLKTYYGL